VRYYPGWYWQKKLGAPTWYYATPWAHIDGTSREDYTIWGQYVTTESQVSSPLTMALSGWYNTSSRQGKINIHIVNTSSNPLSKTYIRCAMTENVGSVKQALRKFYSNGTDTLRMQAGDTVTIAGNATLDRSITFWTRPSWTADSCRLVVFIQKDTVVTASDTTKPIYQGAKVWIRTLPQTGAETAPIVEPPITEVSLGVAEPTPFKATTRISYALPSDGPVSLTVYNLVGAKMRSLVSGTERAGNHTAVWDGCNDQGTRVPQGVYFFELKTAYKNLTTRSVLVR
jgi:hypothetical protein